MLTPARTMSRPGKAGRPRACGPQINSMMALSAVEMPSVRMIDSSGVILRMGAMHSRSISTATITTIGTTNTTAGRSGTPAVTALMALRPARAAYSPCARLTISRTAKIATNPSAISP